MMFAVANRIPSPLNAFRLRTAKSLAVSRRPPAKELTWGTRLRFQKLRDASEDAEQQISKPQDESKDQVPSGG